MARRSLTEHPEDGSVIIAEGVSLQEYNKYINDHPKPPVRLYLQDGNIKAYALPLGPHAAIANHLNYFFPPGSATKPPPHRLKLYTNRGMVVGPQQYSPDMCASPLGSLPAPGQTNPGFMYPTLVFEVATTQPFSEVHAKALDYLRYTPIQLVFTIKVWELRPNNTFAMLGVLYERATPTIAVSCGTAKIDPSAASNIDNSLGVNVVSGVGYGIPAGYHQCHGAWRSSLGKKPRGHGTGRYNT